MADQGVDNANPSTWQKLWGVLMGRDALQKAAGSDTTRPTSPTANQDISVVRRAAEEAGKRYEAEKAAKAQVKPTPGLPKFARGGIVTKFGKYPKSCG